jgi:hypothetical protein
MRTRILLTFTIVLLLTSCTRDKKADNEYLPFEKHIKFNHLFIVVDDLTYKYLSDSLDLIKEFSSFKESNTKTDTESWSGKYLYGKNHYLEIFRPAGYDGAKIGDFGMGFMPNKLGTIDSLYKHWTLTLDSVDRTERSVIENGATLPWFTALSIPTKDTLKISIWLMENEKEEMFNAGFKDGDLKNEIEFWDYVRYSRAKETSTNPDSIKYDKLFDRVNSIKLSLSKRELDYLKSNLLDLGFIESRNGFHGNDVDIEYEITEADHFILKQVDFQLTRATSDREVEVNRLTIKMTGDKASFMFKY